MLNYRFGFRSVPPCSDCWDDGQCSMNCGPRVPSSTLDIANRPPNCGRQTKRKPTLDELERKS